jgi:hypothetical protein
LKPFFVIALESPLFVFPFYFFFFLDVFHCHRRSRVL